MNKYKIKSIVLAAFYGMAILNTGATSCTKEKKLKDLTEAQLNQRIKESQDELASREESSQKNSSEEESEKEK
ncbi:hypothetical protein ACRRVB_04775 [Candidatus Cardinium hertigii]|uniref:hypothetical protein n=1 Tax=Candidatus Cardinium hertigii TaxID=247481 RepID=UPI003D7E771D